MIENLLLTPIAAFAVYLGLSALLSLLGRALTGKHRQNPLQSSIYTGGERASKDGALPNYSGSFVIALFFCLLHVGVLMVGSGGGSPLVAIYLIGLFISLTAFILG
jgi:NADH:ubiquinone oxidoreductase subunit 3 (subunit A)